MNFGYFISTSSGISTPLINEANTILSFKLKKGESNKAEIMKKDKKRRMAKEIFLAVLKDDVEKYKTQTAANDPIQIGSSQKGEYSNVKSVINRK